MMIDQQNVELLCELEDGLPLVPQPYKEIGQRLGMSETQVIDSLKSLINSGVIKRFGAVVRHREFGFVANAMVVWNIDDNEVSDVAQRMAEFPFVTLCYQRPRRLPDWPYNLFCMIHGRKRETVLDQVSELRSALNVAEENHDILFSRRRFKQRGARYAAPQNIIREAI